MKKFESTERFKNLKELMQHLVAGGVITNMDDSCPQCGLFLDEDGLLKWIKPPTDKEEFPTDIADFDFSNNTVEEWRPLPTSLVIKALREIAITDVNGNSTT